MFESTNVTHNLTLMLGVVSHLHSFVCKPKPFHWQDQRTVRMLSVSGTELDSPQSLQGLAGIEQLCPHYCIPGCWEMEFIGQIVMAVQLVKCKTCHYINRM